VNSAQASKSQPAASPVRANPREGPQAHATPALKPPDLHYSADPEETGGTQIITVAAMSGQTIRDISLAYAGNFDAGMLEQIRFLNPAVKDPDRLTPGQLIRLPLPRGAFRKGTDLNSEK
jgi:hypothetical protein